MSDNITNFSDLITVQVGNKRPGIVPRINMKFLNGEISIPGEYGGYVVASGCGSGKTTAIKKLIASEYREGILYSAATIDECNQMYQYCLTLVDEGTPGGLKKDDIVVLHSDYRSEGTDANLWKHNPEKLKEKRILICTHHKLMNEYPELLTNYNRCKLRRDDLSLLKRAMFKFDETGVSYLPRQLILIDEVPTCGTLNEKISKSFIKLLGQKDCRMIVDEDTGKVRVILNDPLKYLPLDTFSTVEKVYNDIVSEDKSLMIFDTSTELGKLKTGLVLSILHDNYEDLVECDSKDLRITYSLADLVMQGMMSRIIIFEGTGDLTFRESEKFKVLTYDNKYSSNLSIVKIPESNFKVSRYQSASEFVKRKDEVLNEYRKVLDSLLESISSGAGTLIVTWKNFKLDGEVSGSSLSPVTESSNPDFDIKRYIESYLLSKGISPNKFDVIHYQSGLDKSTNMYKDFDSVVFLGEFHVPNYVVSEFNDTYKCHTDSYYYTLYQVVQTVCRTRIRQHASNCSVTAYFTSDWNDSVIDSLAKYVANNRFVIEKGKPIDLNLSFIRPKWRKELQILNELNPKVMEIVQYGVKDAAESDEEIKDSIVDGRYSMDIDPEVLYTLIPKSEKKVRAYYPLLSYLEKLGITLNLISSPSSQES